MLITRGWFFIVLFITHGEFFILCLQLDIYSDSNYSHTMSIQRFNYMLITTGDLIIVLVTIREELSILC